MNGSMFHYKILVFFVGWSKKCADGYLRHFFAVRFSSEVEVVFRAMMYNDVMFHYYSDVSLIIGK